MEQLNDNQLTALKWLKQRASDYNERISTIIYFLTIHYPHDFANHARAKYAFRQLNIEEELQVIHEFTSWLLKEEGTDE